MQLLATLRFFATGSYYTVHGDLHDISVPSATCDANYKLTIVVARWPGSTHNSAIIHGSILGQRFTNGQLTGVLLGDTGYALRPWLMTPILNPATNAERRYNRSHRKSRVVIEQTFGQLKRKFPCLALGMRMAPQRACVIIRACCVLFNLSKEFGQPDLEDGDDDNADENDELLYESHIHDGQLHRIMLINRYF
ncbi:putative nuclease HARBI1 [Patiria miniata]|uniref:DDE Tnp4 domain-containing protein n=1 Tax=Patiria miniata TaxID=46514 RepID=A0A914AI18_PATMI|nr:putative nuclease HARBI1 [Patiria miniata]